MERTPHPERATAFEKRIRKLGLRHWRIARSCPWQNGFIERSNRTDNEELFNIMKFKSPEERRYQLRLWEMEYNYSRPHMGIGNQSPFSIFKRDYKHHSLYYNVS